VERSEEVKVLVCDDRSDRCEEVCNIVRKAHRDCVPLCGPDLTSRLRELFETVKLARSDWKNYRGGGVPVFNDADIVILDNNLTLLEEPDAPILTAESIAGHVRAFTKARYLISLNLNPDVDFDLRFLVGDHTTKADLAINTPHLANPALWSGSPDTAEGGFLPWYWPRLNSVATKRQEQIEFVSNNLDKPVLETLRFDEDTMELLSPDARGALSPEAALNGGVDRGTIQAIPVEKLTFRHVFIATARSLPDKRERKELSDAQEKANTALRDVMARAVAAHVDFWFRRYIVAPQDPLVDVPHLLMRLPFLLGNGARDVGEWNRSVRSNKPPYGFEQSLYDAHLAGAEYKHDLWVANPCFWWPKLKGDQELDKYFFAAKDGEWADVVFCEDSSEFRERSAKAEDAPAEFRADFDGPWERRHVARVPGKHYAPLSCFGI
jgi:hypothetical protein